MNEGDQIIDVALAPLNSDFVDEGYLLIMTATDSQLSDDTYYFLVHVFSRCTLKQSIQYTGISGTGTEQRSKIAVLENNVVVYAWRYRDPSDMDNNPIQFLWLYPRGPGEFSAPPTEFVADTNVSIDFENDIDKMSFALVSVPYLYTCKPPHPTSFLYYACALTLM